jgi:hypothetical protein
VAYVQPSGGSLTSGPSFSLNMASKVWRAIEAFEICSGDVPIAGLATPHDREDTAATSMRNENAKSDFLSVARHPWTTLSARRHRCTSLNGISHPDLERL